MDEARGEAGDRRHIIERMRLARLGRGEGVDSIMMRLEG